jgi:hypothetical protein
MRYFQLFRVTGVANKVTYDEGLKSNRAGNRSSGKPVHQ